MKLAYPVGTPDTSKKMLAYCGSFADVCSTLKTIGYAGVELFVRDPRAMNVREISSVVERLELEIAAVGTGPVVSEDRLTFTSPDAAVRAAAVERVKNVIDFAAVFGTQVNIGKLRGDLHTGDFAKSRQWMEQAFRIVCEYAQARKVKVTLEPQNQFVINNLNTTQQALQWIKELQLSNLYLMLDVFHMNIEDRSLAASIIEANDYNIHVHFAENNRGIPGTGHIDFLEIVRVLKALEYDRFISIEINQLPDSRTAAQASFNYLNKIIEEG